VSAAARHAPIAARVLVEGPDGAVQPYELSPGRALSIGRDPGSDLPLPSPMVSRQHASLALEGGRVVFTDASANGSLVDGAVIKRARRELAPGAAVQIGPFRLRIALLGDEPPTPPPALVVAGQIERTPPPAPVQVKVPVDVRRQIHRRLLDHLDLVKLDRARMNEHMLRAKVRIALEAICADVIHLLPAGTDVERLIKELTDEALGLGPLEDLLADPAITEIMVVDPQTIYVERKGKITLTGLAFTDDEAVRAVIERIITPLGRRLDESSPMLDARLPDGSRVNAVIRPLAIRGACLTIRKFSRVPLTMGDLVGFGSVDARMARFLERSVRARKNVLIAGGTGSGKTTLLNVLSGNIPSDERIVTIEDSAELRLVQPHVVSLECRPANMEGKGEVTIRDLVRNAMRMRPDRVVVGEVRGGEALDMLQAMNTGHDGSMTTAHANSPVEALKRIETLALMAGLELPARAIREQIGYAVDLLVQQARFADGTRRITSIAEVLGLGDDGDVEVREIFGWRRTGTGPGGVVEGEFYATGYLPSYLEQFVRLGLIGPGEGYL
jgi:pilus assembly protein CpaF